MRVGLLLVGQKGVDVLSGIASKINISFVQSYDDPNVNDDSFEVIEDISNDNGIKFFKGKKVNIDDLPSVDKIFVIGWQYLLNIDYSKLIVFHDSYLPEYKGWSPTVNYLINNSPYLGATAFQPTDEVDSGPIYHQLKRMITYPIKIKDALTIVSEIYIELITHIVNNEPTPQPMIGDVSFCPWRDKEDYLINWLWPSDMISRFIDAVGDPFDGAKFRLGDETLTVLASTVMDNMEIIQKHNHIGKIIKFDENRPIIICGYGLLRLDTVVDEYGNEYKFTKIKQRVS